MDSSFIDTEEHTWRVSRIVSRYVPPGTEITIRPDAISVPECQREWAWKGNSRKKRQASLIDSVISGYPFGGCILNGTSATSQYYIYDGRHRIQTMYEYANDKFEWNDMKYSALPPELKDRFNNRLVPITIVNDPTVGQLAEIFIRLNRGVPLKDSDYFWAHRDTALVSATMRLVISNERFAAALGITNMRNRSDLANFVALTRGLSTRNAGNISTSYIRASQSAVGLDAPIDDETVTSGLEALTTLYETANRDHPVGKDSDKRIFKKVGKLSAFFIADWLATPGPLIIRKWVGIIGRLRGPNPTDMKNALSTTGAQNLTFEKVSKVLKQVNEYIERGVRVGDNASDDGDDDEE